MADGKSSEDFVTELRNVLQHLYDPATLHHTWLTEALDVNQRANPARALRQTLLHAIDMLKPGSEVPPHSPTWRVYHVLTWRYVEQSPQDEVAANLAVSPRQARRLEWSAIRALADYLWRRYELAGKAPGSKAESENQAENGSAPAAQCTHERNDPNTNGPDMERVTSIPDRQKELAWMKASFPSRVGDVAALLAQAAKTITPLAQASQTTLVSDIPADLPPVAGPMTTLRQAVVSVLTAAIYAAPGGEVQVRGVAHGEHVSVGVSTERTPTAPPATEVNEHLQMARQCVTVFGGALDILAFPQEQEAFVAKLLLPVAERPAILVIDDNADSLQLLERYLSDTPYGFYGVRDPQQALALAAEHPPAIIVLDIMLPEVDGWELLGRLREHPSLDGVPIIVCTILPQDRLALMMGAAGFLRKPVSRDAFLALVEQLITSRPASPPASA